MALDRARSLASTGQHRRGSAVWCVRRETLRGRFDAAVPLASLARQLAAGGRLVLHAVPWILGGERSRRRPAAARLVLQRQHHAGVRQSEMVTSRDHTAVSVFVLGVRSCSQCGLDTIRFGSASRPLGPIYKMSCDNLMIILRKCQSYTIDLRRTSNLQNIPRRTQAFSRVRFTWKIVRSYEIVFVN